MQKPLTIKQILDIVASDPEFTAVGDKLISKIARRIEWEHFIGDDPYGLSDSGIKRQKDLVREARFNIKPPNEKKWTDARLAEVLAAHDAGEPSKVLAERYGVSRHRMYQIIKTAKYRKKRPTQPDVFDGLSVRARNSLMHSVKERTLEAACAWMKTGEKGYNMGEVTRYEIKQFLASKGYEV